MTSSLFHSFDAFLTPTHDDRLVLMTYYGVVLLLSGFHANESDTLKEYQSLVDRSVNMILTNYSLTYGV